MGQIPRQVYKDSMKSTWRTDRKQWGPDHYGIELLGMQPTDLNKEVPVHAKTDKVPYLPDYENHVWVLGHALWPLVLHQAYIVYYGRNMHPALAFLFYTFAYHVNAIHMLHMLRRIGHIWGFFDGDQHPRDQVPDGSVKKVMDSLAATATLRPLFTLMLAYRMKDGPLSMSWWVPVEIGVYSLVLDFWFYWYHRVMHEYDGLWQYHRTHHLTKHPNPLLSLYADWEQEIFDVAGIPLLAYFSMKLMGFPMGFFDWWMCHQYVVFSELFGHSGVRLYGTPPSTISWLLQYIGAELVIEDHDLHHRIGWRKSSNYGKQTRFWDVMFGTCAKRVESPIEAVDYTQRVHLSWL